MPGTVLLYICWYIESPTTLGDGHIVKALLEYSTDLFHGNQSCSRLHTSCHISYQRNVAHWEGQCLCLSLNPQPRGGRPVLDAEECCDKQDGQSSWSQGTLAAMYILCTGNWTLLILRPHEEKSKGYEVWWGWGWSRAQTKSSRSVPRGAWDWAMAGLSWLGCLGLSIPQTFTEQLISLVEETCYNISCLVPRMLC